MKNYFIYIVSLLFFRTTSAMAQRPTNIPYDTEPVRFFESTSNIIIYIVIPLIIVLIYFIWRRKIRKEEEARKDEKKTGE